MQFTTHKTVNLSLEWAGVITAIVYSMLIALNIGAEYLAFILLLVSALLIGSWAVLNRYLGMFLLQFFYFSAAIIGLIRWY
jgi:hypothetical protein